MKCPFLTYFRRYGRCGVSWRMARKFMERGLVAGAYKTKGGHWRIRRPRGVSDRDIALWLHPETGQPRTSNYTHSEPLTKWIKSLESLWEYRAEHQPGRPRLNPAQAPSA
jgi:hypothetical protein